MQFHVDSDEVAGAASRAARSADAIRTEAAAMVAHLTALEGSWQGSASAAFSAVLGEWRSAQAHVESALGGITQALAAAATSYAEAEAAAARMFSR